MGVRLEMDTVLGEPLTVGGVTVIPVLGVTEGAAGTGRMKFPESASGHGAAVAGAGRLSVVAVAVSRGGEVTVYQL